MNTPPFMRTEADEYPEPENAFDRWFKQYYPKHQHDWKDMETYMREHPDKTLRELLEKSDEIAKRLRAK